MTLQGEPIPTPLLSAPGAVRAAVPVVSPTVLENLSARFRGQGLLVFLVAPDGAVSWHDAAAPPPLVHFGLPLLTLDEPARDALADCVRQFTAASSVAALEVSGIRIAAFPLTDRRRVVGALAVAGWSRAPGGSGDEDMLRLCARFELDAAWFTTAAALPVWDEESLLRQARMLLATTRDQVRINSQQQELDSLSNQLSNSYEELSLIYQVSSGMKINRGAADFFRQACLDVKDVLGTSAMGVVLCGEGSCRQAPALYGEHTLTLAQLGRLTDVLMGILRRRQGLLIVNDLATDAQLGSASEYAGRLIAVPLQRQEQVLGCLFALDKPAGDFDSVDSKLLVSIANEGAIYLENAMLFEDVRNLMMGLLHSLTSAVDAKDAYTCGHSERVALLAQRLAREAGMGEPQIERIYMTGLLHDVGKIGVPEGVLQKTGRLTDQEFAQIKLHPEIGVRILADIKQVQDIIPGVLHHHERYDGGGYPMGLAGQHIPLPGRLICLADCFDAMTSSRTYRRELPLEMALIEIRRCSGSQFDPGLAEAFLRIAPTEIRSILSEYKLKRRRAISLPAAAAA